MNHEFNYVYNYYELIENNKNTYINELLEESPHKIKDKQDKFKLIITNFNKYIPIIKNYETVEYIEKINYNKSMCLNALSDLYSKY